MAKIIVGSLGGMSEGAQIAGYMGIKILSRTTILVIDDLDRYPLDETDETEEIIEKNSQRLKLSESKSRLKKKNK